MARFGRKKSRNMIGRKERYKKLEGEIGDISSSRSE